VTPDAERGERAARKDSRGSRRFRDRLQCALLSNPQPLPEELESAVQVDPDGILGETARGGDLAPRTALEEAEEEGLSVRLGQILNCGHCLDRLHGDLGRVPRDMAILELYLARA